MRGQTGQSNHIWIFQATYN